MKTNQTISNKLIGTTPKALDDNELNSKMKLLAAAERKLTRLLVEHIAEVDRRKLYLKIGYDSLFAYLTKEIGYTNGSAQRRIDAARLFLKCPEVGAQIQTGSLNLAQIAKLQMTCREVAKISRHKVSVVQQRDVLQKLQNLKESETDLVLAQEFQVEVKVKPKACIQRDESVRVEITFSKDEMEIIRSAQALLSGKTGGGLKESLVESAKRVLKSFAPKARGKNLQRKMIDLRKGTATVVVPEEAGAKELYEIGSSGREITEVITAVAAVSSTSRPAGYGEETTTTVVVDLSGGQEQARIPKSVTPRLKKDVRTADQCCQFRDAHTGEICGSKFFLEVDHIQPKFLGGGNERGNLRMMCKSHNIYRYHQKL